METYERFTYQEHGPPPGREQTIYDGQSARADKVAAALAALEEGIASLTDSERFKDYLTTMSRFLRVDLLSGALQVRHLGRGRGGLGTASIGQCFDLGRTPA